MDRRAAGALLALAACIASAAAAPTAGNQTALDVYDGTAEGCYYNFQHYGEGDRIMTNEPCLNCTCHNRMLMCYLRVCPFTKPIGQDCSVEKRADQCCPIVTCPDVPVDLLTSTSTSSPAEYGETGVGKLDRYGCSINGKYFSEGSKVPSTPNKPCEHCYCIRNMTTCVMQECTLHVDGCTPIYHKDACCPVRYSCDHPEDEIPLLDDMTTTVRPTPGFLLTTTTLAPVTQMTQDCVHDDKVFADGALIKTEKACQHCYCMKGDIVCVVQECGTPMENEGKNCTSMPPREGQCCPDTYICESDELTTEEKTDFTTIPSSEEITTLPPPRRVIVEGSGYRNEPDEPYTEVPTFEPETEGSGEESFKPIDVGDMLIPEKETTSPILTTGHDANVDQAITTTTKIPLIDSEITEQATTEPDKGENTVPSGILDEETTEAPTRDNITPKEDAPADITVPTTESYYSEKTTVRLEEESSPQDKITTEANVLTTKPAPITETTIADYQLPALVDKEVSSEKEPSEVTEPTPTEEVDKKTEFESTTSKDAEELSTKASDVTDSDVVTTESSIAAVEQAAKTTAAQLPEEDNEVLLKEQTTESSVQSSKPDVIETKTEQAVIDTEVPTASEVGTTPVNPVDNEIDEEPFPTSSPGRIPGEGDCLLDGITYRNESVVPSTNNCHSSCKCISSIVKCDPIICSAPPDYMDNCQPMYDSPESCCPTYVCDHTKETVPPQSHSQMSGTESPVPTPSIECDGDQCEVIKDKDESVKPSEPCSSEGCAIDSSKEPETKDKTALEPQPHPSGPAEDCTGDKCTAQQEPCTGDDCKTPATKDQSCDSENGCTLPVEQPCQGEDCKTQQEPAREPQPHPSRPAEDCTGDKCTAQREPCTGDDCKTPATKDQSCDSENGCTLPVEQPCQEEDCKTQQEPAREPQPHPSRPAEDCTGDKCTAQQEPCTGDDCKTPATKDQSCDSENGCTLPVEQPCQGEDCKTQQEPAREPQPHPSGSAEDCTGDKCTAQQEPCTGDDCKTPATKDQSCDSENGCTLPVEQPCQGEDCKTQQEPTRPAKDDTILCNGPDGCKEKVPENTSDCNGESCIFEPSTVDTVNKEKCDGGDCGTPAQAPETECNEESCVQKPVSDISKLPTSGCTDSECTPQDNVPQITDAPVSDLDVPQATELPISHETERGDITEDITDATKTEREQPSKTTSYEGTESTTQYSEKDHKKEESMPSVTTAPELEAQTTEVQLHDTQTEIVTEKPTTISPFEDLPTKMDSDVTPVPKEEITTQEPKLSPSDTEDETEHPDIETKLPESESTDQSLVGDEKIDVPVTTSRIDTTNEVKKQDASTEAVTESQYKETTAPSHTDKDQDSITTLAPEFELKQDEVYTEAPSKEGPIDVTKEPSLSVTEPTETETTAMDQKETDKIIDESIDKESTSPKYDTETQSPIETTSEEKLFTNPPETTLAPEVADENKETDLPVVILPSEEPATSKPDVLSSVSGETTSPTAQEESVETDTKSTTSSILDATSKPEFSIDDSSRVPEISTAYLDSHVTEPQEITTKQTVFEETDTQSSVTPTEKAPSDLETETPMSIIKDHGDDKMEQTPSDYLEQEQGTKKPDDLIPHGTELYPTDAEQATSVKPEIKKDGEKMPTLSDEEQVATKVPDAEIETTSPISRVETSPEQTIQESGETGTESAVSEASTDKAPATVPSNEKITSSGHEVPITEPTVKETASPQEFVSESVPDEIPDTEKSDSFTELPTQSETEAVDIVTPTRDESSVEKDDKVTDIPELTIHEHVDSIHTTIESGDIVTEKVTSAPDTLATTPQIVSDKEVTETPESIGTSTPEIPVKDVPEEEYITSAPEHLQTEISELKPQDITTGIPEQTPTEPQPISTGAPESQDTATVISETQEKTTEILQLDITTSTPKILATEAEEEQTRAPEPQDVNVPEITTTKDLHKVTEAPAPQDVSTTTSEIPDIMATKLPEVSEQLDIATTSPEVSETEPHKESPEKPDATPSVADSTVAEDKDATKTPEIQDSDIKLYETPTTESQEETTASPESQETESKAPETLVTEAQEKIQEVPDMQDVVTNMPEILITEPQKETTDAPEVQDVSSSVPVMPVTETQKESTESQKEETMAPQESSSEIPEVPVTESGVSDVSKDSTTSIPEVSVTETQYEGTETPESHDTERNVPEITTESQKEASEPLESYDVNVIPQAPETDSPMEVTEQNIEPHKETTVLPKLDSENHDTESSEIETLATSAPTISETEPEKQVTSETEEQELVTKSPETVDSDVVTQTPESQTIATNAPEISDLPKGETELSGAEVTTQSPEILATELHDIVTEAPSQEFATKPAERTHTEAETEEPAVTEKDFTESPLKITTKLDDHTAPAETGMQTESPTVESSSIVPTEAQISNELTTKVPESLVTELEEKTTEPAPSKIGEDKQGEKIVTETPFTVPTKTPEHMEPEKSDATELPISQVPVEFETESPHKDDTKLPVTEAPAGHVTEEVQYIPDVSGGTRKTEITTPTFEQEEVTKAPEEPYRTSETKLEMPETTPYLVLLEEHTHKQDTIFPSDEMTTVSSGLSSEYEPSTLEPTIDKFTEPAPHTESEKPDEDVKPIDIDQDSEKIETPTPEKVTEPTLVSEDITTMSPSTAFEDKEIQSTEKPVEVESNDISTSAPTLAVEQSETQKPFIPESTSEADQNVPVGTEKQPETSAPEEEFMFATTRATTVKVEEELTTLSPLLDKFSKPEETSQPAEEEKPKPDIVEEVPKPVTNEVQTTEEAPQPDEESHFPPTGTSSYGQEPDYGEEDQAFGPGTCRYGGKVYVSAQQIPRDDPCDFCFCFRSDIICLQQSCPPPIHGCHEEPIQGFCCPRYECPVSMANSVNVTTTTTTTTTTLPPHFLPHAYGGMVQRRGCQIKGHTYKVGEVVRASSGPCLHCTCGGDGQMKCDPKVCTPEPMLRQMIAAAVAARRRR